MARRSKELGRSGLLGHAAGIQHERAIGVTGDKAQIVRDQQKGQIPIPAQPLEQLHHLGSHCCVERRRRLIGDQELRAGRERHGEERSLPEPPRETVRILPKAPVRVGESHLGQQLPGRLAGGAPRPAPVQPHGFPDLCSHGRDRVEGRRRLLETEADLRPPNSAPGGVGELEELPSREPHRPRYARAFGREIHQSAREKGLAAAAFADDRQAFARRRVEGHAVHCRTKPARDGHFDSKVAD